MMMVMIMEVALGYSLQGSIYSCHCQCLLIDRLRAGSERSHSSHSFSSSTSSNRFIKLAHTHSACFQIISGGPYLADEPARNDEPSNRTSQIFK